MALEKLNIGTQSNYFLQLVASLLKNIKIKSICERVVLMRNVTKYQLKEVFLTVILFFLIFLTNILLSNVEDFPFTRLIVGVIIFLFLFSVYEISWGKKLRRYLHEPLYLIITVIYYYAIFSVLMVSFIYVTLYFKTSLTFSEVISQNIFELIPGYIRPMFFYFFIFLTLRFLLLQLKTKTLQGIAKNYLFRKPGETISDLRIFMFMDLISSTTYAERLGYSNYSRFIKDIYRELDEFVLETKGAIYQYVGDEVVVVWPFKEGIQNVNCIRFFALFEERILELKEYFLNNYGIFPQFKAGYHYGEVAIAEIGGMLRNDIAFHGDTVNTTARICAKCSELKESILISKDLIKQLSPLSKKFQYELKGTYQLKGKKLETEIFRIYDYDSLKKAV